MHEKGKSKQRPKIKQMKYFKSTEFKTIIKNYSLNGGLFLIYI